MSKESKKNNGRFSFNGGQFNPWGKTSKDVKDKHLLEGPKRKMSDLKMLSSIAYEFVKGFRAFYKVGHCTTFFGSARFNSDHKYYQLARETARLVSQAGFTIMTGGGPGIMEAANRGAKDIGGRSVACNISLPHEQQPNPYLDTFVELDHFFIRKVMLLRYSTAFVVLPGGFGTLDEVFETITLVQTKKISDFPIILMGNGFWQPMKDFIFETLLKNRTISEEDLNMLHFTDEPEEALSCILSCVENRFGISSGMPHDSCDKCEVDS